VPVRGWLSDALVPVAQRVPRRRAIADKVRRVLAAKHARRRGPEATERIIDAQVRNPVR
jgi:hypothetical protein